MPQGTRAQVEVTEAEETEAGMGAEAAAGRRPPGSAWVAGARAIALAFALALAPAACGGGGENGAGEGPAERATEPAPEPEATPPAPPSGRFRTHRFDPALDAEQRALVEQLEALGYARGSQPAGEATGVTVHDRERAFQGYNFYTSGHGPEALLVDMDGRVLHRWRRSFRSVWPDYPIDDANVKTQYLRRAHLFPNGDVLAIFEGLGLVKLDRRSRVLWDDPGRQHHDLDVTPEGDLYLLTREAHLVPRVDPEKPILEDFLVVFDADGNEKSRLSMLEAFERSGFPEIWPGRKSLERDIFHTNSVQVLDGRLADRLPAFRAGNVLVSMRSLDAIAVVDPAAGQVVWAHAGGYARQHDPKVLPSGRLLLFDNLGSPEGSAVLEYDPVGMVLRWAYRGGPGRPFFTRCCGTADRLPNGNTLVTESDNGRAFELAPDETVVWEFVSPHRAGERYIATLFDLVRLPPDFPVDWAEGPDAPGNASP